MSPPRRKEALQRSPMILVAHIPSSVERPDIKLRTAHPKEEDVQSDHARCHFQKSRRPRRHGPRLADAIEAAFELTSVDTEARSACGLPKGEVQIECEHVRRDFHREVKWRVVH